MIDGSDLSVDTAMYIHFEGGTRILVPVQPLVPDAVDTQTDPIPDPDPDYHNNFLQPTEIDMVLDEHVTPLPKRN